MLGPDSRLFTALLIAVSIALLVGAIRLRLLPVKILCGAISIMVAMVGGIAVVNYYYGYYTSWGQLWADFHGGNTGNLGTIAAAATTQSDQSGKFGWVDLPGKHSGYDRRGLVYLPPQYNEAKYRNMRFPVVELFHGTPGTPATWNTVMHLTEVVNSLIARHQIGPMVLVMPSINSTNRDAQECLNSGNVNDETYLTKDVRADVLAHYRVSQDPFEWAVGGYSSGGYCAANLALRHPTAFSAAMVINGYFRAADGPAHSVLKNSQPLENANSPLYLAEQLTANSSPVPAFWVAAGTHDKTDYQPATWFVTALDRFQQVPFLRFNAGDTSNAWSAALPVGLTWLWQQVAPPDLKVLFPVRASTNSPLSADGTLYVPPVKRYHPSPCLPATPGSSAQPVCGNPLPGQAKHSQVQTAGGTFKGAAA